MSDKNEEFLEAVSDFKLSFLTGEAVVDDAMQIIVADRADPTFGLLADVVAKVVDRKEDKHFADFQRLEKKWETLQSDYEAKIDHLTKCLQEQYEFKEKNALVQKMLSSAYRLALSHVVADLSGELIEGEMERQRVLKGTGLPPFDAKQENTVKP